MIKKEDRPVQVRKAREFSTRRPFEQKGWSELAYSPYSYPRRFKQARAFLPYKGQQSYAYWNSRDCYTPGLVFRNDESDRTLAQGQDQFIRHLHDAKWTDADIEKHWPHMNPRIDSMPCSIEYRVTPRHAIQLLHRRPFLPCAAASSCDYSGLIPSRLCGSVSIGMAAMPLIGKPLCSDLSHDSLPARIAPYWKTPPASAECVPQAVVDEAKADALLRLLAFRPTKVLPFVRAAVELKDTKDTINGVYDFLVFCKKALSMTKHGKPVLTMGSSLIAAAQAYLTYEFGIKPTYSDICGFLRDLSSKKYSAKATPIRFYSRGQTLTSWFRRTGIPDQSFDYIKTTLSSGYLTARTDSIDEDLLPTNEIERQAALRNYPVFVADNPVVITPSAAYCYRAVATQQVVGKIFSRLLSDHMVDEFSWRYRYGFSNSIIKLDWDIIPWSFLIDWFINVGDTLQRLDRATTYGSNSVFFDGFWQSVRTETVVQFPAGWSTITWPEYSNDTYHYSRVWNPNRSKYQWYASRTVKFQLYQGTYTSGIASEKALDIFPMFIRLYSRTPYRPELSVVIPRLRYSLKSFQLSTGAALIVTNAKKLAHLFKKG